MKIFKSKQTSILTILLSALGFASSCSEGRGLVMYGTPHVNYKVKAKVVDQELNPVEKISLNLEHSPTKFKTDKEGIAVLISNYSSRTDSLFIEVTDESMIYKDSTYGFEITKDNFTEANGDSWYLGEVKKSVDIVIEKRENE